MLYRDFQLDLVDRRDVTVLVADGTPYFRQHLRVGTVVQLALNDVTAFFRTFALECDQQAKCATIEIH